MANIESLKVPRLSNRSRPILCAAMHTEIKRPDQGGAQDRDQLTIPVSSGTRLCRAGHTRSGSSGTCDFAPASSRGQLHRAGHTGARSGSSRASNHSHGINLWMRTCRCVPSKVNPGRRWQFGAQILVSGENIPCSILL